MKIFKHKPTKAQIKMLIKYGIVERFSSFGYCNPTEKAEGIIHTGHTATPFHFRNSSFIIKYYDGCFYPIINVVKFSGDFDKTKFVNISDKFKEKLITDKDELERLYDCF